MPVPCQVRSKTKSPCPRRAVVEIWGVAFCGPCARKQEAYFAIGELTQEEMQGLRSKPLAEALARMRRERADGTEGIAAGMHHGLSGVDEPRLSRLRAANLKKSFPPQPPLHKSPSANLSESRFRALLAEGSAERFDLTKA